MAVLYLDYDGVLHPGGAATHRHLGILPTTPGVVLFQYAPLLVEDLRQFPQVRITLSTAWQLWRGHDRARAWLPQELRARVIGGTYHSRIHYKRDWWDTPRGLQIWGDVCVRQPRAWVALDDDYLGWPAWCRDRCVRTDEDVGLADPQVRERLRALLAEISADNLHPAYAGSTMTDEEWLKLTGPLSFRFAVRVLQPVEPAGRPWTIELEPLERDQPRVYEEANEAAVKARLLQLLDEFGVEPRP